MTDTRREVLPEALAGERLDRVVSLLTELSRSQAASLIEGGAVHLDGEAATVRSTRVTPGAVLEVDVPAAEPPSGSVPDPDVEVPVVFVDDSIIIVDKPADLVVHPGAGHDRGTLVQGLLARYPDLAGVGDPARPGVVHRLDKGTSGLLVVARTPEAYTALVAGLAARRLSRRYLTLVEGRPEAPRGLVDAPIGRSARDPTRMAVTRRGREARTGYEVLGVAADGSRALLRCTLETGRTHQIRVHLASIGLPVVGDARYGRSDPDGLGRQFLHAAHLGLTHPATGVDLRFDSPLPAELRSLLAPELSVLV